MTRDGEHWSAIDGRLAGSTAGPLQMLSVATASTTFRMFADGPDAPVLTVPTIDVRDAIRVGDQVRVSTPTEVLVSTDGERWDRYPLDLEHGFTVGDPVLLPTPEVSVAGIGGTDLVIYRLRLP